MTRRVALVFGATLLVTLAASAAACGSFLADELTPEEYFQRLDELGNEFETRSDAAAGAVEEQLGAVTDEQEQVAIIRASLAAQRESLEDFVGDVEDLDPSEEAEDPHNELVAALREVRESFEDVIDQAAGEATSPDELFALLEDSDFTDALDRAEQACLGAEGWAADNGITVDLACGDE